MEEDYNNINENKENNKKNYFNLIIGISTLIIALLGASFAYFTMTGGSQENDVTVQAAYVKIGYEGGTKIEANDLIPTSESVMLWAYQDLTRQNTPYVTSSTSEENAEETSETQGQTYQCIDKNNKKVCYVYRFTISSDGDEGEQTKILGKIRINTNTFIQTAACGNITGTRSGISYMVFKIGDSGGNPTYTKVSNGTVVSQNSSDSSLYEDTQTDYRFIRFGIPTINVTGTEEGESQSATVAVENFLFGSDGYTYIDNNVENTYELVIWLHDDGCEQDIEQGKKLEGTIDITVDSSDNLGTGGRITGERE